MDIKVLQDRVLVGLFKEEEITPGGLYIPEVSKQKINQGIVISIGEDENIKVKAGDKVVFDAYAGTPIKQEIKEDKVDCLILKNDDILAIIED